MRKPGKKFAAARQQVPGRPHTIEDAVPLMQRVKFATFDETVEIALRRVSIRSTPTKDGARHGGCCRTGLGKSKRVLAIAGADK